MNQRSCDEFFDFVDVLQGDIALEFGGQFVQHFSSVCPVKSSKDGHFIVLVTDTIRCLFLLARKPLQL